VKPVKAGAQGFNQSQFGMWLQHKASMLFEDAPELAQIEELTETIEGELLPMLRQAREEPAQARGVVGQITAHIDRIKALLASMFDRYIEVEDGRDNLTNLLSRRYLPSVAQREIALAQRHGGGFAALMLEIDGFEALRDALGLEASDQLLAQVASHITDRVRAGDFVFRVAEAQFLVLVVETQTDMLLPLAQSLRQTIVATPVRTTSHASASVTVCIGAALFDGHPDYQRLVDRASEALRAAQTQGGNRCLLAD
jgi:diguanylate cyclase